MTCDSVDVLPEMWYNLLNSAQTAQEKRKGYSMKIVLVGGGKVGTALARQLSEEGHNVTVIDTNKARVEHIGESYDVMSILGNGSSITTPVRGGRGGSGRVHRSHRLGRAEPAVLHVCQKGGPLPRHRPRAQPVLQP